MPDCKACGAWFGSVTPQDLCPTCERALERLKGYAVPVVRCKGGKPVTLSYGSFDHAFKIRHAKSEDSWHCYIMEPILLDAVSLADAAEGWNRRFDNE